MARRLSISKSVTKRHPDKVCDQISSAVLDDIPTHNPAAYVAYKAFITTGTVIVMGEIITKHHTNIPFIVRRTVERIGYTDSAYSFDYRSCMAMTTIDEQPPDITMGVSQSYEHQEGGTGTADFIGAGGQDIMFGYAYDEMDVPTPAFVDLAHKPARQFTDVRRSEKLSQLRPDDRSQVTVEYDDDGKVLSCPAIVVPTQHDPDIALEELREAVVKEAIKPIIPAQYITKDTKFCANPTGRFVVDDPMGDTGLTECRIVADTYGGSAAHGGDCFSGKGPTKVDRSVTYATRYIVRSLVTAGLCHKCQIGLAYAIGVAYPVSVLVDTYGVSVPDEEELSAIVDECFDICPAKIIEHLDLRRPIYEQIAAYGHFGHIDVDLPWEHTDMVEKLRSYL